MANLILVTHGWDSSRGSVAPRRFACFAASQAWMSERLHNLSVDVGQIGSGKSLSPRAAFAAQDLTVCFEMANAFAT
jgi:hypothetical protein